MSLFFMRKMQYLTVSQVSHAGHKTHLTWVKCRSHDKVALAIDRRRAEAEILAWKSSSRVCTTYSRNMRTTSQRCLLSWSYWGATDRDQDMSFCCSPKHTVHYVSIPLCGYIFLPWEVPDWPWPRSTTPSPMELWFCQPCGVCNQETNTVTDFNNGKRRKESRRDERTEKGCKLQTTGKVLFLTKIHDMTVYCLGLSHLCVLISRLKACTQRCWGHWRSSKMPRSRWEVMSFGG